jgi:hypothetical protein
MHKVLSAAATAPARSNTPKNPVAGDFVELDGARFYVIRGVERMEPFLISLVSPADHWFFVASNGGLTAGRRSPDTALFPYETDDRLYDSRPHTGPLSIFWVRRAGAALRWEPFDEHETERYRVERNLYKDPLGTTLIFEEINHDLGLAFRAAWQASPRFGFVRSCRLEELHSKPCAVTMLDGLQNLLPYSATTQVQRNLSNLLDAYKRAELDTSGLGIFALSSMLTDQAEASESLRATVAWQLGLADACTLLSSAQVAAFRRGESVQSETDVRGRRGAYLLATGLDLAPGATHAWRIVADLEQDATAVAGLSRALTADPAGLAAALEADLRAARQDLEALVAAADGLQCNADPLTSAHHAANTLFNIMRGGVFVDGYSIDSADLRAFVATRNPVLLREQSAFFAALPARLEVRTLREQAAASGVADLERLCGEYLPLTFSRRHGDPSRPWNRFAINVFDANGARRRDYQGNWRDLFQNWEPLGYAFPSFLESMVATFLSATTADGYNPYRVARSGVEWEAPEPENPWANIGYWSDHQIIYLLKLMEALDRYEPGRLRTLLDRRIFSHVDVPYRIKPYADLLLDPTASIEFAWEHEHTIAARVIERGSDGKLLHGPDGRVVHVSLTEKLLLLLLTKLVNFVPEGGIWMNTQRPEWNDANNALVGKGLSVVTLAYLRRYLVFCRPLFAEGPRELAVSAELFELFEAVVAALRQLQLALEHGLDDQSRRALMDRLGRAGDSYRQQIYAGGLSGAQRPLSHDQIRGALDLALTCVEHSLRANRRPDGLYHSYNTLSLSAGRAAICRLDVMLEGQVAILSSGLLAPDESLALLRSLRSSRLYRADQHSYLLYPDRDLPGFRQKNRLSAAQISNLALVAALDTAGDARLISRDVNGEYHFCGDFRNARDLRATLDVLAGEPAYAALVRAERLRIEELFEQIFRHAEFTGRSGSFFAYEGLGSIYWHMVAKLLLAVQENYAWAVVSGADPATLSGLAAVYHDLRSGLGFRKSPALYGAFPTDPYSHTPAGRGVQQPGMTGQVKEELLTRMGELGVTINAGWVAFRPRLLDPTEWGAGPARFDYVDLTGQRRSLDLPPGTLAFTLCQTPVLYRRAAAARIYLRYTDGSEQVVEGDCLDTASSRRIFGRDGTIALITAEVLI